MREASADFEERYAAALEDRGLEDVRPLYRELLVRLKKADPEAYEEGIRRYREVVEPALDEGNDPLGPWLRYGAWLARRLTDGELTAVAPDGAATPLEGERGTEAGDAAPPATDDPSDDGDRTAREREPGSAGPLALGARTLLLHLPADDGEPALPLAVPADPTPHQEATREILCG